MRYCFFNGIVLLLMGCNSLANPILTTETAIPAESNERETGTIEIKCSCGSSTPGSFYCSNSYVVKPNGECTKKYGTVTVAWGTPTATETSWTSQRIYQKCLRLITQGKLMSIKSEEVYPGGSSTSCSIKLGTQEHQFSVRKKPDGLVKLLQMLEEESKSTAVP